MTEINELCDKLDDIIAASVLEGRDAWPLVEAVIHLRAASTHARLLSWAFGDDTGMSSKALARTAAGLPPRAREANSYPSDTHDFGRCIRLIEAVPEARSAVDVLASAGPVWARLAERWDDFAEKHRAGTLAYPEYKAAQQ